MQAYLKQLSDTALLGTEKRELPPRPKAIDALLSDEQSQETQLLSAAGAVSLFVEVAQEANTDNRLTADPAAPELQELISKDAEYYLVQFLRGKQRELLRQGLKALADSGKRVPHRYLVEFLELGKQSKEWRPYVQASMGKRGAWLARQNSSWSYAIQTENHHEAFDTGQSIERVYALTQLRKEDAQQARELLSQGWSKESAKDRTAFIDCLEEALSLADQDFLESALDDKSKTVREASATLLSSLPDSALSKRMTARALSLIQYQASGMLGLKKAKLELVLPSGVDDSATRDGLALIQNPKANGKKADLFKQIVSRVPLAVWGEPGVLGKMIEACPKTERDLLVGSFVQACARFKETAYTELLLNAEKDYDSVELLAPLLSSELAASIALQMLIKNPKLTYKHPFGYLIQAVPFTWSDALRKQFLKVLRDNLAAWAKNWQARTFVEKLGRGLPPELRMDLATFAPEKTEHAVFDSYREMLGTLEFREKMLKAFADA